MGSGDTIELYMDDGLLLDLHMDHLNSLEGPDCYGAWQQDITRPGSNVDSSTSRLTEGLHYDELSGSSHMLKDPFHRMHSSPSADTSLSAHMGAPVARGSAPPLHLPGLPGPQPMVPRLLVCAPRANSYMPPPHAHLPSQSSLNQYKYHGSVPEAPSPLSVSAMCTYTSQGRCQSSEGARLSEGFVHQGGRADRLNALVSLLASEVAPSSSTPGARRAKHVVLEDTLSELRRLRAALQQRLVAEQHRGVEMAPPPPLPALSNATGIMVQVEPGSFLWVLRITCRDRPGLLADVTHALSGLPLAVAACSVTTTPLGKSQQVFQLQVCDPSLSQDELQCAVNAALYSPAPPPSFEHWSLAAEPIGMQELGYELGGVKRARV